MESLRDMKASFSILFTILAWISFFALAGFYLFRYTFEGNKYFLDLETSLYSMMTALTTANFPDVMLPAYYEHFWVMLFFLVYLILGIYFLLSILIANVFNKYKNRLEERINEHSNKRRDQIEKAYAMFDKEERGSLTSEEFKEYFAFVFDTDMEDRAVRH